MVSVGSFEVEFLTPKEVLKDSMLVLTVAYFLPENANRLGETKDNTVGIEINDKELKRDICKSETKGRTVTDVQIPFELLRPIGETN